MWYFGSKQLNVIPYPEEHFHMHLIFKAESNVPNLMSVKKPAENSRSEARKLCKSSLPFNVGFDSNFYNTKQHG